MGALRYHFLGVNLLLLPLAMFALLVFTAALGLWVSALNVRYRDTQHLLGLALLAWFWLTPIVYPGGLVYTKLAPHPWLFRLYLANPMADIVFGFQRALYAHVSAGNPARNILIPVSVGWLALLLGAVSAGSLLLLWLAWRTFFHLSGDFAEEL
jgi:ABC-2 type transport system permease protein